MTAPLFRLGLVVACTGYVLGLVTVAGWAGVAAAVVSGVVGVLFAVVLAENWGGEPLSGEALPPQDRRRTSRYEGEQ